MTWTPEKIVELKRLWNAGETAQQIAVTLGDGLTRNAVIGKAHRLDLPPHSHTLPPRRARGSKPRLPSPTPRRRVAASRTGQVSTSTRRRAAQQLPPLAPAPRKPSRIGDLTSHTCCWPEGDPRKPDFQFCGRQTAPGKPYCPHHAHRAVDHTRKPVDLDKTMKSIA